MNMFRPDTLSGKSCSRQFRLSSSSGVPGLTVLASVNGKSEDIAASIRMGCSDIGYV